MVHHHVMVMVHHHRLRFRRRDGRAEGGGQDSAGSDEGLDLHGLSPCANRLLQGVKGTTGGEPYGAEHEWAQKEGG